MTRARRDRKWPRMKRRGKHRDAELTILDHNGRVTSRSYRKPDPEFMRVRISKRNGIRLKIIACPGADRGCRHCYENGYS